MRRTGFEPSPLDRGETEGGDRLGGRPRRPAPGRPTARAGGALRQRGEASVQTPLSAPRSRSRSGPPSSPVLVGRGASWGARLGGNKPFLAPFVPASRPAPRRPSMPIRLGLLALVALTVAACGGGPPTFSTAQEAYDRGMAELDRGKYALAIEHLRASLDFGRTGELADDAQLALARAYAADRQYLIAANEFTRFIEFYRADPRVPEAAFERIEAYVALSPRYELDQTDTRQALGFIRSYVQQYPESPRVAEAEAMAAELREKLARKLYEAGRLYARREMYGAAVNYFREVLAEYPTSVYADDAMLGAVEAQIAYAAGSVRGRQEGRYREALDLYDQLVTLFPASPLLGDAQGLYDRAYAGWRAAGGVDDATAER